MSSLSGLSRPEIEALFDIAHDEYKTVCQQNAALKKKLAKAVEALRFYAKGEDGPYLAQQALKELEK